MCTKLGTLTLLKCTDDQTTWDPRCLDDDPTSNNLKSCSFCIKQDAANLHLHALDIAPGSHQENITSNLADNPYLRNSNNQYIDALVYQVLEEAAALAGDDSRHDNPLVI